MLADTNKMAISMKLLEALFLFLRKLSEKAILQYNDFVFDFHSINQYSIA